MSQTGTIFDISHYMLEDGPGIRTNVFLKGCSLRCKWCSNAYGLEKNIQMAYTASKCIGCGKCVEACSQKVILIDEKLHVCIQDFTNCKNCMQCVAVCPAKARNQIGTTVAATDVVKEVLRDRMFYRRGEGGVTLSGGEILLQPAFAREILKRCSHEGINTAIETSAMGKWEDLEGLLSYCDTVFIDCKCVDREQHKELTGVYNDVILDNIKKASTYCKKQNINLIIRLPLIPTLNDSEENIRKTAEFVAFLESRPLLNVLPYHNFGASKYEYLGKEYATESLKIQSKTELERVRSILDTTGICYSIGGYDI